VKEEMATAYMAAGAAGVISRSAALSQFVRCVREAMKRKTGPLRAAGAAMLKTPKYPRKPPPRPADTLTPREKAVIGYLMQGLRNRDIAQSLSIAEQTVKNHLRSMFDKIGVSDRLELVLYALHQRLDIPPIEAGQEPTSGTISQQDVAKFG
jgi:DNA-binding NarL/FixJ family response regulator